MKHSNPKFVSLIDSIVTIIGKMKRLFLKWIYILLDRYA